MKKMLFIGGDKRMIYAAEKLSERFACYSCGLGEPESADIAEAALPISENYFDYAVLPLPASRDGVNIYCPLGSKIDFGMVGKCVKRGGAVFTSKSFPALESVCRRCGIEIINYFEREELAVLNAVPTAEGALAIAINELPVMINGLDVLVTGYGRIGRLTARYFAALGAEVRVSARKKADIARITADGLSPVDFNDEAAFAVAAASAELIVNTVPFPILEEVQFGKDAVLIELASQPCTGERADLRIINAGGLPGKLAPVSAGRIIAGTIENILDERSGIDGNA